MLRKMVAILTCLLIVTLPFEVVLAQADDRGSQSPAKPEAVVVDPIITPTYVLVTLAIMVVSGVIVVGVQDRVTSDYAALAIGYAIPETDLDVDFNPVGKTPAADGWDTDVVSGLLHRGHATAEVAWIGKDSYNPFATSQGDFHNRAETYKKGKYVDGSDGSSFPPGAEVRELRATLDQITLPTTPRPQRTRLWVTGGKVQSLPSPENQLLVEPMLAAVYQGGTMFDPDSNRWVAWRPATAAVPDSVREYLDNWSDPPSGFPSLRQVASEAQLDGATDFSWALATAINATAFHDSGGFRTFDPIAFSAPLDAPVPVNDGVSETPWYGLVYVDSDGEGEGSIVSVGPSSTATGLMVGSIRPNPSAGKFLFELTVPFRTRAQAVLYDVAGKKIASITKPALEKGTHCFDWPDLRVPAGMYFLRVEAGGKQTVSRVVVVH